MQNTANTASNLALSAQQVSDINHLLVKSSEKLVAIYHDYIAGNFDIKVQTKADSSPVTYADITLHKVICDGLADITPDIFCLSEESEDEVQNRQSIETLWLLDPVDGTRAFIDKTGEFTTNLALVHEKKVLASWLVVPTQQQLYYFLNESFLDVADSGLYAMDMVTKKITTVSISPKPLPAIAQENARIKVGLSRSAQMQDYNPFLQALEKAYDCKTEIVQASSAYKFVQMLRGEIDVYVRAYPTCEWDTAAGQGMIESLGGQLINFRGNPFLYNSRNTLKNGGFVCFKHADDRENILATCQALVEED